jgi:hypothetical protein
MSNHDTGIHGVEPTKARLREGAVAKALFEKMTMETVE